MTQDMKVRSNGPAEPGFSSTNPWKKIFPGDGRTVPLLAWVLLVAGLFLTAGATLYIRKSAESVAIHEFSFACDQVKNRISARIQEHAQILRSGSAFFDINENITREQWHNAIAQQNIEQVLPGIQGIGFSTIIQPGELTRHEKQIRSEGFPLYAIRPAGKRDLYTSIIYLEPFAGRNLRAFGYDMFSEPVRRKAMELARDFDETTLSGKVRLVQETEADVQAGTLLYVPVYNQKMPVRTVEERRRAIRGWVYSPYRMTDLMKGILGGWELGSNGGMRLEVFDDTTFHNESLLYDSRTDPGGGPDSGSIFTEYATLSFNSQLWSLRFTKIGGRAPGVDYSKAWYVMSGGVVVSGLLFTLYLLLVYTRSRAQAMAQDLTRELRESEEKYRIIFNNEIYAICIFDVESLAFLEVNEAQCKLYGYSRNEFLSGMTVPDISAEAQSSLASIGLMIRQGATFIPLRQHKKKDGSVFPIEIVGGPYTWMGRKVMFALGHDISERKKAEGVIEGLLAQKELILKEVHHRIKNNMNTVKSLLSLQASSMNDPSARSALKDAEGRVRSMMQLYNKLYRFESYSDVLADEYLGTLVDEIINNFPNQNVVTVRKKIDHFLLDAKRSSSLGMVVNELITNAMKHAFVGRESGSLIISMTLRERRATCIVQDDGVGLPVSINMHSSPGFGLQLVDMLTEQLDGVLRVERDNGTKFTLEFET